MKKILFFILAISMLSATASFAGGRKKAKKAAKVECSKECPRSGGCNK